MFRAALVTEDDASRGSSEPWSSCDTESSTTGVDCQKHTRARGVIDVALKCHAPSRCRTLAVRLSLARSLARSPSSESGLIARSSPSHPANIGSANAKTASSVTGDPVVEGRCSRRSYES